jgi:hypothetical protein
MRALLLLMAGSLGIGDFWRRVRDRVTGGGSTGDPAAELRAKLAETKETSAGGSEELAGTEESEEPDAEQPVEADDPAVRRNAIHERARSSIDELGSPES